MGKCYHTGLPQSMCGHCNGTSPLEKEPFAGRKREEEEPRLVKGRDKAEWQGRGQTFGNGVDMHVSKAVVEGSHAIHMPNTAWGKAIAMRDVATLISKVGKIESVPMLIVTRQRIVEPTIEQIERIMDGQAPATLPHKAPQSRRLLREGSTIMRHARKSGRAGAVLASVRKRI